MAGIGFELRRILQKDTFGALARAYFFGSVIVLGPFLCSVLCLAGLSVLSVGLTDLHTRQIFTGAVVYVFGGSLVTTGLIQVVVTRYLADQVYRGEYDSLIESLFPVLAVAAAVLGVTGLPIIAGLELSVLAKVTLYTLYVTIGCLWLTVVFVSSAHGHRQVVLIFFFGSFVALLAGILLLQRFGLEGLLLGYTVGHFLMLALFIPAFGWAVRRSSTLGLGRGGLPEVVPGADPDRPVPEPRDLDRQVRVLDVGAVHHSLGNLDGAQIR